MPKICTSCRFYSPRGAFNSGTCVNIATPEPILEARDVCDKEGDGHFVYFEPKAPAGGAAFETEAEPAPAVKRPAPVRSSRPLARAAAGGVL